MNGDATFRVHTSVKNLKQLCTRVDHLTPLLEAGCYASNWPR